MIPDNILILFILLLMVYIFENKLYPQMSIVFLSLYEIYYNVVSVGVSEITQDRAIQVFLFLLPTMYAILQVYLGEAKNEGQ